MNPQIVPSPVYCYDGVPAYKSGEWEGSKPNHFGRTRLILKPVIKKDISLNNLYHKNIFQKKSPEFIFKQSKKPVVSYFQNIAKRKIKSGRKYIEPKNIENNNRLNRFSSINELRSKNNFISNSIILPNISKKRNDEFNTIKNSRNLLHSSSELNLENMMTRKKRIYSLNEQRNYYKEVNPGDKNYRYAECSPDFFKEGGPL